MWKLDLGRDASSTKKIWRAMPTTLSKEDVLKAVQDIPNEEVSIEEIVQRLLVLKKVKAGLAESGQGIPQSDVVASFEKPTRY